MSCGKKHIILGLMFCWSVFARAELPIEVPCQRMFADANYGLTQSELKRLNRNGGNLLKLRSVTSAQAEKMNEQAIQKLKAEPSPISRRKTFFEWDEMQKLFDWSQENPQLTASLCGVYKNSKNIGLCWGRAMGVHFKALWSGIDNRSVRKVWVVGNMKDVERSWRYHGATAVRGPSNQWFVVDPIQDSLLPIENWVSQNKVSLVGPGNLRLFITPASRFAAGNSKKYNKPRLKNEIDHGFFVDLMDQIYFEETGKTGPWGKLKTQRERSALKTEIARLGLLGAGAGVIWGGVLATDAFLELLEGSGKR